MTAQQSIRRLATASSLRRFFKSATSSPKRLIVTIVAVLVAWTLIGRAISDGFSIDRLVGSVFKMAVFAAVIAVVFLILRGLARSGQARTRVTPVRRRSEEGARPSRVP